MRIKRNVALSEAGYLFNPASGESFSVNPIGSEILELLKESKDFDEIRSIILSKYDTDDDTFEKDFQDFLGMLTHFSLLEEPQREEDHEN